MTVCNRFCSLIKFRTLFDTVITTRMKTEVSWHFGPQQVKAGVLVVREQIASGRQIVHPQRGVNN